MSQSLICKREVHFSISVERPCCWAVEKKNYLVQFFDETFWSRICDFIRLEHSSSAWELQLSVSLRPMNQGERHMQTSMQISTELWFYGRFWRDEENYYLSEWQVIFEHKEFWGIEFHRTLSLTRVSELWNDEYLG